MVNLKPAFLEHFFYFLAHLNCFFDLVFCVGVRFGLERLHDFDLLAEEILTRVKC